MKNNYSKGFTLVELMVTITIIGILAGIAGVSYNAYTRKVRLAEAYSTLNALSKAETSYFLEHRRFFRGFIMPSSIGDYNGTTPSGGKKVSISEGASPSQRLAWKDLGNPVAYNSQMYFQYYGSASKSNSEGKSLAIEGFPNTVTNTVIDPPMAVGPNVNGQ